MNKPAIGIDLGNTHYRIAVCYNNKVEILSVEGETKTPAYVAFKEDNTRLIGLKAHHQVPLNSTSTLFDAKKLIGRKIDDPIITKNTNGFRHWPFEVVQKNEDNDVFVKGCFDGNNSFCYDPETVVAMVLKKMLDKASAHLDKPITEACIGVPASFSYQQRQAVMDAGAIAGLEKIHLIHEGSAVALAYGFEQKSNKKVLFVDWGGAACSVSLVEYDETGRIEVKATSGIDVGGEDFTDLLAYYGIKKLDNRAVSSSWKAILNLRRNCEQAKIHLSVAEQAEIAVDYKDGSFETKILREDFEKMCDSQFQQCLIPIQRVLMDTNTKREAVDEIVLVGGSTRIPKIRQLIKGFFGKEISRVGINHPDEVAVRGAALQARLIMDPKQTDVTLIDVTPFKITLKINKEQLEIPAFTIFPQSQTKSIQYLPENANLEVYENEKIIGTRKLSTQLTMQGKASVKWDFYNTNRTLEITVTDLYGASVTLTIPENLKNSAAILHNIEIEQRFQRNEKEGEKEALEKADKERVEAKQRLEEYTTQLLTIAQNSQTWISSNQSADKFEIEEKMDDIMMLVEALHNYKHKRTKMDDR